MAGKCFKITFCELDKKKKSPPALGFANPLEIE